MEFQSTVFISRPSSTPVPSSLTTHKHAHQRCRNNAINTSTTNENNNTPLRRRLRRSADDATCIWHPLVVLACDHSQQPVLDIARRHDVRDWQRVGHSNLFLHDLCCENCWICGNGWGWWYRRRDSSKLRLRQPLRRRRRRCVKQKAWPLDVSRHGVTERMNSNRSAILERTRNVCCVDSATTSSSSSPSEDEKQQSCTTESEKRWFNVISCNCIDDFFFD